MISDLTPNKEIVELATDLACGPHTTCNNKQKHLDITQSTMHLEIEDVVAELQLYTHTYTLHKPQEHGDHLDIDDVVAEL